MAITLAQIRAFRALAQTGRHVLAAEKLNVSQPAVSTQIRSLEEDYCVVLFNRTGGTLVLSDLGERLLSAANSACHFLDVAEELLVSENNLSGGTLRIGADHPAYVMRIIAGFKQKYPNVAIHVEMGGAAWVIQKLLDYEIDVAIVTSVSEPTDFHTSPYYNLSLEALVPLGHPWTKRQAVSLSEVASEGVILRERGSLTRQMFHDALENDGLSANIILQLNSQLAVREAVKCGLGISVELIGGLSSITHVERVPIRGHELTAKEYISCHKDRVNIEKIKRFFECAAAVAEGISHE